MGDEEVPMEDEEGGEEEEIPAEDGEGELDLESIIKELEDELSEGEDEEEDAGKADGVSIAPNTPRPKQQRVL